MGKLHNLALAGSLEGVKKLLATGGDVNERDQDGAVAVHHAAFKGHLDIVNALIEAGIDFRSGNAVGYTPLMAASREGRTDVVKALLAAGAPPDAQDQDGKCALILAAGYSPSLDVLPALLQGGAGVDLRNKSGGTALMAAAFRGNVDAVRILLEAKADRSLKDGQGRSAADLARAKKHSAVLELLEP